MPDVVQPAMHGRDHCEGGSDPIPCLRREFVHLFTWNYDTDNTVPDQTWLGVANFGLGRGYFEESYSVGVWGIDYDSGTISTGQAAEYLVTGWVQFNEDAAAGEQRMVAVCRGSTTNRYINEYTFQTESVGEAQAKLGAPATPFILGTGNLDVFLAVWHNAGGDLTINDAELSVYRWQRVFDTDYATRP
jgi:hypothetical protein